MYKVPLDLLEDIKNTLDKLVQYSYVDEKRHYDEYENNDPDKKSHIFHSLVKAKRLVKILDNNYINPK